MQRSHWWLIDWFFCFSANTTRIFEGSRIVKTGMVSGSEGEQICLCVMCLCEITINNFCVSSVAYNFSSVFSRYGSHKLRFFHLDVLWNTLLHCLHGNGDGPLLQWQPGHCGISGDKHLAGRLGGQRRRHLFSAKFCRANTGASSHAEPHPSNHCARKV